MRAGTCFTLATAVFPAGTQSGSPSSEEPRTWGRKGPSCQPSVLGGVWPHTGGHQYVSVNGWREASGSDGRYGVFLSLPSGNREWALLNIKILVKI